MNGQLRRPCLLANRHGAGGDRARPVADSESRLLSGALPSSCALGQSAQPTQTVSSLALRQPPNVGETKAAATVNYDSRRLRAGPKIGAGSQRHGGAYLQVKFHAFRVRWPRIRSTDRPSLGTGGLMAPLTYRHPAPEESRLASPRHRRGNRLASRRSLRRPVL
jgi:hypothetical protein